MDAIGHVGPAHLAACHVHLPTADLCDPSGGVEKAFAAAQSLGRLGERATLAHGLGAIHDGADRPGLVVEGAGELGEMQIADEAITFQCQKTELGELARLITVEARPGVDHLAPVGIRDETGEEVLVSESIAKAEKSPCPLVCLLDQTLSIDDEPGQRQIVEEGREACCGVLGVLLAALQLLVLDLQLRLVDTQILDQLGQLKLLAVDAGQDLVREIKAPAFEGFGRAHAQAIDILLSAWGQAVPARVFRIGVAIARHDPCRRWSFIHAGVALQEPRGV